MINLRSYENWKSSLSEEKRAELVEKRGMPLQVPELFNFGLNKLWPKAIYPVSGNFTRFTPHSFFEGISVSLQGHAYIEGIFEKDKGIFKMVEFYEMLHSRGDWCEYDLSKNKKGIWGGKYFHMRDGKICDKGTAELITLENKFIETSVEWSPAFNVLSGASPKKLKEFWNELMEKGHDVPHNYLSK